MEGLRSPDAISEEIRDLDRLVMSTRAMLEKYPDDFALRVAIEQDQARKQALLVELDEALAAHREHAIKFIFKNDGSGIALDSFITSLNSFKRLLDKTFEVLCSKPISLEFRTVFSGSFGTLLTTPPDEKLLDSDYEKGFSALFEILKLDNFDSQGLNAILSKSLKGDKKLIKRFADFMSSVVEYDKNIEINWTDNFLETRVANISAEYAYKLSKVLREHQRIEPEYIEVKGRIKALNLLNDKVSFLEDSSTKKKKVHTATFKEDLAEKVKSLFDVPAFARFEVAREINEATEDITKKLELLAIGPQDPSAK